MDKRTGLTLVELIVALILSISAVGVLLATYIMINVSWRVNAAQLVVQRQGQISFEKITRALRKGHNAIIENNGDSIRFENADETESKIYLESTGGFIDGRECYHLIFDLDTSQPGDEKIISRSILKQTGVNFFTADSDNINKIFIVYRISDTEARDGFQVIDVFSMVRLRN